jgi:hypothetical protein
VSPRLLSFSEIQTANTCQARHAFAYTGHLTGGKTLHRRAIASTLSNGRAWGAAVAAWHAFPSDPTLFGIYEPMLARIAAHEALRASYRHDVEEQLKSGVWVDLEAQVHRERWMMNIADHYMSTADRMNNLTRLEGEVDVPIPSRTGRRSSTRYRFTGFLDGFTIDRSNSQWIAEFKLRTSLTDPAQIQLSRQIRWYAWARQRETDLPVVGCLVDERLAEAPKPARLVQAKRKSEPQDEFGRTPSHAQDQMCTAEAYIALCLEYGVEPHPDVIATLRARVWQVRHPVIFRRSELKEAGEELVSAAKFIQQLDSGELWPVRNASPQLCRGCKFKEACPDPDDQLYLDTIFERRVPKRLREPEQASAAASPTENGGALVSAEQPTQSLAPAPVPEFSFANAESEEVPWKWT